jgi:hypothetical protein
MRGALMPCLVQHRWESSSTSCLDSRCTRIRMAAVTSREKDEPARIHWRRRELGSRWEMGLLNILDDWKLQVNTNRHGSFQGPPCTIFPPYLLQCKCPVRHPSQWPVSTIECSTYLCDNHATCRLCYAGFCRSLEAPSVLQCGETRQSKPYSKRVSIW